MILVNCPKDMNDENIYKERDYRKYCMMMPVWFYSDGGEDTVRHAWSPR